MKSTGPLAFLFVLAGAMPGHADDAAAVTVLRGASAPPPPAAPAPPVVQTVVVAEPVYVPLSYYPAVFPGYGYYTGYFGQNFRPKQSPSNQMHTPASMGPAQGHGR